MNKIYLFFSWVAIVFAFIFMGFYIVWAVFPYKIVVFENKPFSIITPSVKQGGVVEYTVSDCKYMNVKADVSIKFVNELIYTMPTITTNNPIGCHKTTVAILIPKELPIGQYHIEYRFDYQVNPIRNIEIKHSTEEFIVASGEAK